MIRWLSLAPYAALGPITGPIVWLAVRQARAGRWLNVVGLAALALSIYIGAPLVLQHLGGYAVSHAGPNWRALTASLSFVSHAAAVRWGHS